MSIDVVTARARLEKALAEMVHIQGKSKADARCLAIVRRFVELAAEALTEKAEVIPLPLPAGARQGISTESRAEWRR